MNHKALCLLPSKHKQNSFNSNIKKNPSKNFPKVCHQSLIPRHKKKKTTKEKSETISFVFIINNRFTFRCYDYAKKVITKSTFSNNSTRLSTYSCTALLYITVVVDSDEDDYTTNQPFHSFNSTHHQTKSHLKYGNARSRSLCWSDVVS